MEETLKAKIGCKKIKPRRKFKCDLSITGRRLDFHLIENGDV